MTSPVLARRRGRSAQAALFLSAAAATVIVALARAPPGWEAPDLPATDWATLPWGSTLRVLTGAIPALPAALRIHLLFELLLLGTAVSATWATYQLFRGPGRLLGAVTAGPLTVWSLLALEHAPVQLVPGLAFSVLMTLAVGHQLRTLVHLGSITEVARARSLVAAGIATTFLPTAGVLVFALLAVVSLAHRRRKRDRGRLRMPSLLLGIGLPALAWVAGLASGELMVPTAPQLAVGLPGGNLGTAFPPALAYPALVLVALLVAPLRWRGGGTLAMLVVGAFVIHDGDGLLAPEPARIVILTTGASGWIWIAGSIRPRRRVLARVLALAAAASVFALRLAPEAARVRWPVAVPVAKKRPERSLVAMYQRGLVAPGDVALITQPWLRDALKRDQVRGLRPDVTIVDVHQLTDRELGISAMEWTASGRRIVSDSFSAGGRWSATWAVDAGTVYWFVGDAASDTDLVHLGGLLPDTAPDLDPIRARYWEVFFVERARFRRIRGDPDAALRVLPLRDRGSLVARRHESSLRRAHPTTTSELRALTDLPPPPALAAAEAGDLLLSNGDMERGRELLTTAADTGYPGAWGALARWQLRAGSSYAAEETLERISQNDALRGQALDVLDWLVARGRLAEAQRLLDRLAPARSAMAREITGRLGLLAAQAGRSINGPADSAPP